MRVENTLMNENPTKTEKQYFKWLVRIVGGSRHSGRSYLFLLKALHKREFYWIITNDENRAGDGRSLRLDFKFDKGLEDDKSKDELAGPCSVLEMLVGLSRRIEMDIMSDPKRGNRTKMWFWEMINNLGLSEFDDNSFDLMAVNMILDRFLDRKYDNFGRGSLFYMPDLGEKYPKLNWKALEIWSQMHRYFENRWQK